MALRTVLTVEGVIGLPPDSSGKSVSWSEWHLDRLAEAMAEEQGLTADEVKWFPDEYTFKAPHLFVAPETEVWFRGGVPGEDYRFPIPAGAIYHCFRDR